MPTLIADRVAREDAVGDGLGVVEEALQGRQPPAAELGQQSLADDALQGVAELELHQVALDRVEEADDAVDHLVGGARVQGADDEVAGGRRVDGRPDRVRVAHLADDDHVGGIYYNYTIYIYTCIKPTRKLYHSNQIWELKTIGKLKFENLMLKNKE